MTPCGDIFSLPVLAPALEVYPRVTVTPQGLTCASPPPSGSPWRTEIGVVVGIIPLSRGAVVLSVTFLKFASMGKNWGNGENPGELLKSLIPGSPAPERREVGDRR